MNKLAGMEMFVRVVESGSFTAAAELSRVSATMVAKHVRAIEERLAEAQATIDSLTERNEKLANTLRDARDQVVSLKEEVDRLAQPPSGYGVFLRRYEDDTVDVFTGGRKLRVSVSPSVSPPSAVSKVSVMPSAACSSATPSSSSPPISRRKLGIHSPRIKSPRSSASAHKTAA